MQTSKFRWYVAALLAVWGTTAATLVLVFEGEKWLGRRSDVLEWAFAIQFYAALVAGAALWVLAARTCASSCRTTWGTALVIALGLFFAALNSVVLFFAEFWFGVDVMGWI
jgi:hypothetical protein